MNAEKLEDWELEMWDEELCCDLSQSSGVGANAKRALVGAGARALFYPTLLYNVVRNKIQPEFHWWDRVDEESNVKFILLGAVPFAADVPCLKKLGVGGVVTLNESYETLVPTLLYHAHSIDHLVIPTRDYLFAPSLNDTCRAVDFIYSNASLGRMTYVHCKAGRGRSTTIVLCYLVEHKQMTPDAAYNYVKSIRPRVVLASAQWKAVQDYYLQKVKKTKSSGCINNRVRKSPFFPSKQYGVAFDDDSIDIVTESDLDGYESYGTSCDSIIMVTQSELDGYDSSCNSRQETARKKLGSSVAEIEVF
ncbi:phosphatidylglycerophosphate phosphatase PTPMT2 isoform X3 [Vitis vinifera]|uniref:phosphatidylglycerophosphate phosphatase PTPMT2 isoform X3 n=1 Tax=Vitis vinifera TaxID=29760 RepID=UPI0008FECF74|nr:phosphatidylglycerophosphate phosphatase PTPMT2 isoform X3 [Vitis vinifera]|eukprot:XP_019081339.1 PREDICTED: putative dual specificity protein phosphatase DSP8 isoform X3 [Vitis vinifera]